MGRLEAGKKGKSAALEAARKGAEELKGTAAALESAGKLAAALDGIKVLRELKEAKDELAGLAAFAVNELPAYRALRTEQLDREKALGAAQAALEEQKLAMTAAEAALGQLFSSEKALKKIKARAESVSAKLRVFAAAPKVLTRTVSLPARWGIWAAGAALAGFVAYSGPNFGAYAAAARSSLRRLGEPQAVGAETMTGHTPRCSEVPCQLALNGPPFPGAVPAEARTWKKA